MTQPSALPPIQPPDPAALYRERATRFGDLHAHLDRRARQIGNLSLLLFLGAVITLTVGSVRGEFAWYGAAALLAVAFLILILYRQRLQRQVARAGALAAINREGLLRLARDWQALPPPLPGSYLPGSGLPGGPIDAATAADLDLLGVAGLQHLLNTPTTPVGQATLRHWLLHPAAPPAVAARQAAVRELAPQADFRDELGAGGRQMGAAQAHYERFVGWAESPPWLAHRPWLLWTARLLPLLTLALAAAAWYAGNVYRELYWALGAVLFLCLALTLTLGRQVAAIIGEVEAEQDVFGAYAALFDLLSAQPFTAAGLRGLQDQLAVAPGTAHPEHLRAGRQMARLEQVMPFASIRRWVLFFPVEVVTLWNVHLLWLLERWQVRNGAHVRAWLAALGEFEALVALATLHHDHPAWTFPTLRQDSQAAASVAATVAATDLAHPLLPPARAVGNDVTLGPPGSFLLVTGSNMSGKSTLLRAIGVNCVLAQMGAPVCAGSLELPPLTVVSSMRVQDSLAQGVSFFMAELRGLKAVVDVADAAANVADAAAQPPASQPAALTPKAAVLYLLDEILQGTNTAERQIAARQIIRRLLDAGAIGAVSTHDLTLAAAPELAAAAVPVHFTESFTRGPAGPAMHFDYRLRSGVATSTNALKLMEMVGLA